MTKHTYEISVVAGWDEATITLELDDDQASLLRTIEHMMHRTKQYFGRPSIIIDKISD